MKRLISFILVAVLALPLLAEEQVVTKPREKKVLNDYSEWLPKQGEFSIGFSLDPLATFVGNMFNGNLSNGLGDLAGEPLLDGIAFAPASMVSIMGTYMQTDQLAWRLNLGLGYTHKANNDYVLDDEALWLDPFSRVKVMDCYEYDRLQGSIALGMEYRVGKTSPVQGVFGAGLNYAFGQISSKYAYGNAITELNQTPITQLAEWFEHLLLPEAFTPLLLEIRSRLQFMQDVGLGYLTLSRMSSTLSGGEGQRINLAKSLGSSLVGSLYVLDEPSIGLHPRDTQRLIHVLKQLRDLGNTIVVVEHDDEIQKAADYTIEIGPKAGRHGGEVVYAGAPKIEKFTYAIPPYRRSWNNYIEVSGATENNLKNINVRFPLNVMTVVTGVSGSGKSSLITKVLYPALKKHYGGIAERTGDFGSLRGSLHLIHNVEFVDQNPLTKSSRSNPVTYLKAYDEIRKLYAEQQLSKQLGFTPSHFSFNTPGGRCEACQGEGKITIEMQFMADVVLECEHCHGKRFKQDVLDVLYRGKNIYDILEMTVNQAIEFFSEDPACKKIVSRLRPLQDVGIGYVKLGQSGSTLSGGESQRVKLASFLSQENALPTLFIFDEPTTGLHHHDVAVLLKALNALISRGHSVLVIEHNPSVILAADHIIDLGPEGGDNGGKIVAEGTPEEIIQCSDSHTGKALNELKDCFI